MVRIGQKYSKIRIHVENRTKVFENQNTKNATSAVQLEIQNGASGKHQYKPRCPRQFVSIRQYSAARTQYYRAKSAAH